MRDIFMNFLWHEYKRFTLCKRKKDDMTWMNIFLVTMLYSLSGFCEVPPKSYTVEWSDTSYVCVCILLNLSYGHIFAGPLPPSQSVSQSVQKPAGQPVNLRKKKCYSSV